jgi:hypothetical protein
MALINCKECNYEFSNRAIACPKCGCPTSVDEVAATIVKSPSQPTRSKAGWVLALISFILLLGSGAIYSLSSGIFNTALSGIEAIDEAIPPQKIIEEQVQIKEDEMLYYSIPLNRSGELQIAYNVRSGPGIDAYLVDADNFYRWQRSIQENVWDEGFRYNSELSSYGTNLSDRSSKLPAGDYYLILDNSDWGDSMPPMNFSDDVATIDVAVTFE